MQGFLNATMWLVYSLTHACVCVFVHLLWRCRWIPAHASNEYHGQAFSWYDRNYFNPRQTLHTSGPLSDWGMNNTLYRMPHTASPHCIRLRSTLIRCADIEVLRPPSTVYFCQRVRMGAWSGNGNGWYFGTHRCLIMGSIHATWPRVANPIATFIAQIV